MTQTKTNRRRLVGYAVLVVGTLLLFRIPAVQNVVAETLIEFIQVTEKTLCIPCPLLHHDHCFSLDRFDPSCPQCF